MEKLWWKLSEKKNQVKINWKNSNQNKWKEKCADIRKINK